LIPAPSASPKLWSSYPRAGPSSFTGSSTAKASLIIRANSAVTTNFKNVPDPNAPGYDFLLSDPADALDQFTTSCQEYKGSTAKINKAVVKVDAAGAVSVDVYAAESLAPAGTVGALLPKILVMSIAGAVVQPPCELIAQSTASPSYLLPTFTSIFPQSLLYSNSCPGGAAAAAAAAASSSINLDIDGVSYSGIRTRFTVTAKATFYGSATYSKITGTLTVGPVLLLHQSVVYISG
jgi:hypothetical protein